MPVANNILPFGASGSANVLAQASYSADAQRPIGNQPGVARSDFVNKVLKQANVMSVALAQFIADHQTTALDDTLDPTTVINVMLKQAVMTAGGVRTTGVSLTLTQADSGKLIVGSAASPITMTLPLASAVPVGTSLKFVNVGTSTMSVQRAGTDGIASGAVRTIYVLQPGDSMVIQNDGGTLWYIVAGNGTVQKDAGSNAALLAGNGYQKFPSGVILQWGTASGVTPVTITFPIAWPTGLVSITGNVLTTATNSYGINFAGFTFTTATATPNLANAGTNVAFNWIAVGF